MKGSISILIATILALTAAPAAAEGDPVAGRKAFLACAVCHSADPKVHKTGPSLATIWRRRAGTIESFGRYSDAMRQSSVVWDASTLDAWLQDPAAVIPGTSMRIRPISDTAKRRDIIAYLQKLAADHRQGRDAPDDEAARRADPPNLKDAPPANKVDRVTHCDDTYTLRMANGETLKFWEFNLRLKTDSSARVPHPGSPVLMGAGMRGDRASLIFTSPAEIGRLVTTACPNDKPAAAPKSEPR